MWVCLQMHPAEFTGIHCTNPSAHLFFLRCLFGSQSTGSLLEGPELFLITLLFKRWHPSVSWQWFRYWTSLGSQRGECICSSSLCHHWASLQAQLVWLMDCKDSQIEQLTHLTAWFPHHVLTQPKLHMSQYLQHSHCCTTLTGNTLLTEVLWEPIKMWNQIFPGLFYIFKILL